MVSVCSFIQLVVSLAGCGNGRYLGVNGGVYKTGIDVCQHLVDDAKLKGESLRALKRTVGLIVVI